MAKYNPKHMAPKRRQTPIHAIVAAILTCAMIANLIPAFAIGEAVQGEVDRREQLSEAGAPDLSSQQVSQEGEDSAAQNQNDSPAQGEDPAPQDEPTPEEPAPSNNNANEEDQASTDDSDAGQDDESSNNNNDSDANNEDTSNTTSANQDEQDNPSTEDGSTNKSQEDKDKTDKAKEDDKNKDANNNKETDDSSKADEQSMPAFSASAQAGKVEVRVNADEGVFPKDARLVAKEAEPGAQDAVEDAVSKERADDERVAASYILDIKVVDADGKELQPAKDKSVRVSFACSEVANANLSTSVYHANEAQNGAIVADELQTKDEGSVATVTTDGFSYYTVEFTYGSLQYVLQGDAEVELATILQTVGLVGTPTLATTSKPALFEATQREGTWYVRAKQAFTSEEWLKVTIDGVEYQIAVTDEIAQSTPEPTALTAQADVAQSFQGTYIGYKVSSNGFNVVGYNNGSMIKTTYSDSGYRTAMMVDNGSKTQITGFQYGAALPSGGLNGVTLSIVADVPGGQTGKTVTLRYTVKNNSTTTKTVKFGSSADTQIGGNDSAPVSWYENGLKMDEGGNGNVFYLLPAGDFTTRWLGRYSGAYDNMFNNSTETSFSGDSGVAWSWTVTLAPGQTVTKACTMAAGAAESLKTFEVTYNGNGATSGSMSKQTVFQGDSAVLNPNAFTKTNHKFIGWATSASGNVAYADGATLSNIQQNYSLYAKWQEKGAQTITASNKTVTYGNTANIGASALGGAKLTYSVASGSDVVSVDSSGKISTKKPGTATITISAAECADYKSGSKSITVTVNKRPVTLNATAASKTYSAADPSLAFTVDSSTPLVSGDTIANSFTGSLTRVAGENVGNYAIQQGTVASSKYAITFASANLTINRKTVGLTWANTSLTYNGQPQGPTATATGLKSGDTCTVTVTGQQTNAGSNYTATASSLSNSNYALPSAKTTSFSISKGTLTVTAKPKTITYGDAPANDGITITGFQGSDTEAVVNKSGLIYSYTYTQYGNVGTYKITPSGLTAANYNISYVKGDLTVVRANITITPDDKSSKYRDDLQPLTYKVSGAYHEGDDLGVQLATTASKTTPVATYPITATWNQNQNYNATLEQGTYTITKADLATSAEAYLGTYDRLPHGITVTLDPSDSDAKVYYSTEIALTQENFLSAGSLTNPTRTNVGTTTVYYYVDTPNFDPQPVSGSKQIIIDKAPLKVTAKDNSVVYGEEPQGAGVTYEGLIGADATAQGEPAAGVVTGTLGYDFTYTQFGDTGKYAILPKGLNSENYQISFIAGMLNVTKRPITVTATAKQSEYLQNIVPFEYTVSQGNVVNDDPLDVTYTCDEDTNKPISPTTHVGSYTIVPRVTNERALRNYEVSYEHAPYTVTKCNIAGIDARDYEGTYDGRPHGITAEVAQHNTAGAEQAKVFFAYHDFATMHDIDLEALENDVTGEVANALRERFGAGGDLADSVFEQSPTATNVDETPLTVYYLVLSDNYHVVRGSKTIRLKKAKLTVTAKPKTITYGDAPNNDGVTYEGFVGSQDDERILSGTLTYGYDYHRYMDVGTYHITPKGLSARDYEIEYKQGDLVVEPLLAKLSWIAGPYVYNGGPQGPVVTVQTVNGDGLVPDGLTDGSTMMATEVGEYTAKYTKLEGEKAKNYVLDQSTAERTWKIEPAHNEVTSVLMDGWTYGQAPTTPHCTSVWGKENATYEYSSRPDTGFVEYDPTDPAKAPTDAGTYYLRVTIPQTAAYAGAQSEAVPFVISKAKVTISAKDAWAKYDATATSEQLFAAAHLGDSSAYVIEGAMRDGDDLGVALTLPTPASGIYSVGSHEIRVAWNRNPNYEATLNNGAYHITEGDVGATAIGYVGTYDGQSHGITVTPIPGDAAATIYYATQKLDSTNYDTVGKTEPVTRKDAGTTTVYWYVAPTSNPASGLGGSKDITIQKKRLHVLANNHTIAYGDEGTADGVTYTGLVEGDYDTVDGKQVPKEGVLQGTLQYDFVGYSVGSDIGTYPIVVKGIEATNYEIDHDPATLTVDPRVGQIVWEGTEFVYNGELQGPVAKVANPVGNDARDVTIHVSEGSKVHVGEYVADIVSVEGEKAHNYVPPEDGSVQQHAWRIVKASNSATISVKDWTYGAYDEAENAPKVTAAFGQNTAVIAYGKSENGPFDIEELPRDAGTYWAQVTVPGTDNYNQATAKTSFTIEPASLIVASQDNEVEYVPNMTREQIESQLKAPYVEGLVGDDDLGITQGVEDAAYAVGGVYVVTPTYDSTKPLAKNYNISLVPGKVDLVGTGVSATSHGYSGTYDGHAHGIVVELDDGSAPADIWYSTKTKLTKDNYNSREAGATRDASDPSVTRKDVGTTTVFYYVAPRSDPSAGVSGSRDIIVRRATLIVSAADQTITYGDAPDKDAKRNKSGLVYTIPSGMVDDLDVSGMDFEYDYAQGQAVGGGVYSVTPKGVTSQDYDLHFVAGTLNVERRQVTVKWPEKNWFAYENKECSVAPESLEGVVSGDDVLVDQIVGNKYTDVGAYTAHVLSIKGTDAANYVLRPSSFDWQIVQQLNNAWDIAPTIGHPIAQDEGGNPTVWGWTYGKAPEMPKAQAAYGNRTKQFYYKSANADNDAEWEAAMPTQAGDYVMRAVVPENPRYTGLDTATVDPATGKDGLVHFTIERANVAIVPDDKASGYGKDILPLTYEITGDLASGDSIEGIELACDATNTSPVGEYPIRVTKYDEDPNYVVDATQLGTYQITKTNLPVTASGYEGVYDDVRHGITVTHEPTLAQDDATIYYSANELTLETFDEQKDAGNVTTDPLDERVSLKDVGELEVYYYVQSSNYQMVPVYGSKTITITKAPLTITANDHAITFGDVPTNNGVSYKGFVGDDTEADQITGETTYAYGCERFGNVGDYAITPSGLDSHNYEITYADGTLTVNKRAITRDMLKLDPEQFTHDGQQKKPTAQLVLTLEDGTTYTLEEGRDFTVSDDAGDTGVTPAVAASEVDTYALTVTGTNNFMDAVVQTWRIDGGNELVIDKQAYGNGNVIVTVDVSGEGLSAGVVGLTPELAWKLLDEAERERVQNGEEAKVYLVLKQVEEPDSSDRQLLDAEQSKHGATTDMYFDVTLWKRVGNSPATMVSDLGSDDIDISIDVPESAKNKDTSKKRSFFITHAHGGKAETVAESITEEKVPFKARRFSLYSLGHKDENVPAKSKANAGDASALGLYGRSTPLARTADTTAGQLVTMFVAAALLALVAGLVVKRDKR